MTKNQLIKIIKKWTCCGGWSAELCAEEILKETKK